MTDVTKLTDDELAIAITKATQIHAYKKDEAASLKRLAYASSNYATPDEISRADVARRKAWGWLQVVINERAKRKRRNKAEANGRLENVFVSVARRELSDRKFRKLMDIAKSECE